jgi:hypothetical protein
VGGIIMSLQNGGFPSKQPPVKRGDIILFGDCFTACGVTQ